MKQFERNIAKANYHFKEALEAIRYLRLLRLQNA